MASWREAPENHAGIIESELSSAMADEKSSRRTMLVHQRITELTAAGQDPHAGLELDWDAELDKFAVLQYPEYYRQPFHSVSNGWLSTRAATKNRVAMQAIYRDAHSESCLGIRKDLATFVPANATTIVDFGSGELFFTARCYGYRSLLHTILFCFKVMGMVRLQLLVAFQVLLSLLWRPLHT